MTHMLMERCTNISTSKEKDFISASKKIMFCTNEYITKVVTFDLVFILMPVKMVMISF